MNVRHTGLIAATFTPLAPNGSLNLDAIGPMTEQLIQDSVSGLYVCGSTGEGMSLSTAERKLVAEEFVRSVAGRIPVFVQVGHNSLTEARELANHAAKIGADALSATCPSYFKVNSIESLCDCMREIAAGAPDLPFYYYHIPSLTGNQLSMPRFLEYAGERIENLQGLKYTTPELHVYQQCAMLQDERFEVFWGTDEMLLPALVCGAKAAIGSTYNIAAKIYLQIIEAFQAGDLEQARLLQSLAVQWIATILDYPFHAAMKEIMRVRGIELGPCRLPLPPLAHGQAEELHSRLSKLGFTV